MIHFTLVVIIVQGAAPPPIQEQPIVQEQPIDAGIQWRCPHCNWWNTYEDMRGYTIGSKAHLRRCPKR
jgi:hypothetical protein